MGDKVPGKEALFEGEDPFEREIENITEDEESSVEVISSGNLEVDRKMDGGVPVASLSLLEGVNDSGKSVLLQQIMWGALNEEKTVLVLTTEKTSRELLKQMEGLSLDISDYFIIGRSRIFSIEGNYIESNPHLSENLLQLLLECIKKCEEDIVIIDSLTVFVVNSSENAILNFFTECVKLCDKGKTILISVHGYAFSEALLSRVRTICNAYLEIRIEQVGDQLVKTMEIQKLRGARKHNGNSLSFDVDSNYGLKIVPVSKVKA